MSQALSEFRSPVGQEALRLRMVAMHGREDALLDAARFPRLLRQANDAEVADVRKVGDDDYEISAQGGSSRAALPPAGPAEELQPAAPTSDTTQDAGTPGQRDNGQRFGVRFRRGSRAPSRGGEIPLVGVVRIEPPMEQPPANEPDGPTATEAEAEASAEAPAKRPRPRRPRKRAAAPASEPAVASATDAPAEGSAEAAPRKRGRTRTRKKAE
ncbi:MAG: hypothetical protein ACJ8A6_03615 [Gemmatimonadales bacterium]